MSGNEQTPRVSVVIPVFNDLEGLARCLDALSQQSYPAEQIEVIVVDNGSTRDLSPAVERYPGVQMLSESKPSSYAARNTGLETATGEIIGFTDADCIPDRDWVANAVAHLHQQPDAGFVGGRINVFPENPDTPTGVELFEMVGSFPQELCIQLWHFSVTANLFTTRRCLDAVGTFSCDLKSGGDVDWGQRVHAAGFEQVYGKNVVVGHPARKTMSNLLGKARRIQGGLHDMRIRAKRSFPVRALLPLAEWPRFKDCMGMLGSLKQYGAGQRLSAYVAMRAFKYARVAEACRLLLGGDSKRF